MEFIFETLYDQKALSIMARALRKTIRKKHSKRSHIFGILIIILAILLSFKGNTEGFTLTSNFIITWIVIIIMVLALIFEDSLNAFFAKKRALPGTEKAVTTFKEDVYVSETNAGRTEFFYGNINILAESDGYFIFVFNQNHAQLFDKNNIVQGTSDEFRKFITEKTGKEIQKI
ncbi:MAG: YcxB family protein [Firmicutes bacterium]|nr:YcxB family protein [Bacillota bacterium]